MATEREGLLEGGTITFILPPGARGPESFPDWRRDHEIVRLRREMTVLETALEAKRQELKAILPNE